VAVSSESCKEKHPNHQLHLKYLMPQRMLLGDSLHFEFFTGKSVKLSKASVSCGCVVVINVTALWFGNKFLHGTFLLKKITNPSYLLF